MSLPTEDSTKKQRREWIARWAVSENKGDKDLCFEFYQRWKNNNGACQILYNAIKVEIERFANHTNLENHAVLVDDSIEFKRELGK